MPRIADALDQANQGFLASLLNQVKLGKLLRQNLNHGLRKKAMTANAALVRPQLGTLGGIELPDEAKAARIVRATIRAGAVTGELTPVAYGTTPATTQIAVAPNGDIVVLAADAPTDLDIVYEPEPAFEVVTLTDMPVVAGTGVLTIPPALSARGVILLIEANATSASVVGKKIVLVPGAAPATLQARLNVAKTQVLFNVATDVVTKANVVLAVAYASADDPNTVLERNQP